MTGPRYDILALDIDGTLLTSEKRLLERDVRAIRAASAAGVHVVLATARPPRSTRPILEALGLLNAPSVTINYNGALVWRHETSSRGAHIEHLPLEPILTQDAVRAARKIDPKVLVWIEILDKWYTDNAVPDFGPEHLEETEGTLIGTETSKTFAPDEIGHLDAFLRVPATKVMFLAPPSRLTPIREAMELRYAREGRLACKVSDAHLFSICHAHADKSLALRQVAHRLAVPRERVLAIGDAPNDAGMLRWAGRGLAVSNAWPEARDAAHAVLTLTNDQSAVAHAIETELL
ncbi:MAG: Cof-type HAD-IIB family hydrolase [Phycisphaerales bacterium]